MECKQCGYVFQGNERKCPFCGYVVNSRTIHSDTYFSNTINSLEQKINSIKNLDKKESSTLMKVLYVLLCFYTLGIPLIYRYYKKHFKDLYVNDLHAYEKNKFSFIDNYEFDLDYDTVYRALVYMKNKVEFLSRQNIDSRNAFWMKTWEDKAEMVYLQYAISYSKEQSMNNIVDSIKDIVKDYNKKRKAKKKKFFILIAILFILVLLMSM